MVRASAAEPSSLAPVINPLLLASASSGYVKGLNILLNGEDAAGEQRLPFDLRDAYASGGTVQLSPGALLERVTIDGDTALHAVASNGDDDNFLKSAELIYSKAEHLLFVQNKWGDTPLHLAARAGKSKMVSRLIALAKGIVGGTGPAIASGTTRVKALLEIVNGLKETVLHEAVRIGSDDMVRLLMDEDPELARFPEHGTSPLYLAILLENKIIAKTLYGKSGGILSYSGPNGQNALHAAVWRDSGFTKMLLEWNKDITAQGDENGKTPLHFAAGTIITCRLVLEANPAALYQADHEGLYPIHVAASVGSLKAVIIFLEKCPSTAGLQDAKGRTFLHVAVGNKILSIVRLASRYKSLSWILNMRDNEGNTALHLAAQAGSLRMVCALLGNLQLVLNLTNDKGDTPLDMSTYKIPPGIFYAWSSEVLILHALREVGARGGASFQDHLFIYQHILEDESKVSDTIKQETQNLSIGAVLIATVTFGATFALPGGYRADDHHNGGTPTLAGRHAFNAFMMANALSFICSLIATVCFMYSGTSMINLESRRLYIGISVCIMRLSISSLAAAFALGVYLVLTPVDRKTAIAICVLSSLVVLSQEMEYLVKLFLLARPFFIKKGLASTLKFYSKVIAFQVLGGYWPVIVSFAWAAYARK